ncbi:MAG TPA: sulfite exporter TauE/SafE family protein [Methanospirillum sp.]|nr:sulfite exporter TauE/SafE family protein [Methanospirillum sp.]
MFVDGLIITMAAFSAGFINALAGGGTLVSFPTLLALGITPITANITNTLALCPGYFGGMIAQRREFPYQKERIWKILPLSIIGGLTGGFLLIHSDEMAFRTLIPYLILFATLLLAVQAPLKRWIVGGSHHTAHPRLIAAGGFFLLFLSSIYGGYFGAGVSVIIIAVLGLLYDDSLASLNILKIIISFSVNVTAAIYFIFTGTFDAMIVVLMSIGSIMGGLVGGTLVEMIHPELFRWIIVALGFCISIWYFLYG